MALPHPLAPPRPGRGSLGSQAPIAGAGGAGTGRGPAALPAPTAKVCQVSSSPGFVLGGAAVRRGAGPVPRAARPRQGASSAREKPARLRERIRTGVRPPPPEVAQLLPWSPGPAAGTGSCCCQRGGAGFGSAGPGRAGRGRGTPAQRVAHRGAPPGDPSRTPRRRQARAPLLPHNGERNLQPPLNCCKTNPRYVRRAGEKVAAPPRAPSPPAAPAGPTPPRPQLMGGPGASEGRARLGQALIWCVRLRRPSEGWVATRGKGCMRDWKI